MTERGRLRGTPNGAAPPPPGAGKIEESWWVVSAIATSV